MKIFQLYNATFAKINFKIVWNAIKMNALYVQVGGEFVKSK